jgi:hypothetical protein
MSSFAVSCCTYSPEASFASATLASSPTGDGQLFCPSAFNYSAPYHNRRYNQQHPPPSKPVLLLAVPNAAGQWSSSRSSLPLRSCSVLRLRSSVPHETHFQNPQISIPPSARSALVRLAAEKRSYPYPRISSNCHHLLLPSPVSNPYCSSPTKHTGPSPTSCHPSTPLKTHSHIA